MWWEFKVIITAGLFLVISSIWRGCMPSDIHRSIFDKAVDRKLGITQVICSVSILLVVLWFIWGPTKFEPAQGSELKFQKVEK